jgi:hypothetical protein
MPAHIFRLIRLSNGETTLDSDAPGPAPQTI